MPRHVPRPPPAALEGDYSDWTIYDSFDDAHVYDSAVAQEAIVNKTGTMIIIVDSTFQVIKVYDISAKTLSSPLVTGLTWDFNYRNQGVSNKSVLGTYVVATNASNVYVFKDGGIIKTISASELGLDDLTIWSASISQDGKYIVVSGRRTATGNNGWVLLEGS